MNNIHRELNDIKYDLKIIMSNKLSIFQSKLLFMGIIYEIILSKELFSKNSQLKEFVNGHLVKYLNKGNEFKDYLFKTRTILAATIQKQIYNELDYNNILDVVEELYKILPDRLYEQNKRGNKKNSNYVVSEWLNFLKDKEQ